MDSHAVAFQEGPGADLAVPLCPPLPRLHLSSYMDPGAEDGKYQVLPAHHQI